jgi:hypothetical protein
MEVEDWPRMESCPRRSTEPFSSLARRAATAPSAFRVEQAHGSAQGIASWGNKGVV